MSMNPQKPKKYTERRQIRKSPDNNERSVCLPDWRRWRRKRPKTSAKRPCISTVLIKSIAMFLYIWKCPLSNWRKSTRNPNKCVKSEREICALRSLVNEWRSSIQKSKTIQTVQAVDALLLISISHNGNGQKAPPSGIFWSQQFDGIMPVLT